MTRLGGLGTVLPFQCAGSLGSLVDGGESVFSNQWILFIQIYVCP